MRKLLKSFSIFRKTHLLLLFSCAAVISVAQGSFTDQTVTIGEDEFLPFCRGEVYQHFEGDKALLMKKIYGVIASWDSLNPPKGFEASFTGNNNMLDITFAAYVKQGNSKIVKSGAKLSFFINDLVRALGSPVVNQIFLQPEKIEDFYGSPVFQNTNSEVTVISKSKSSLFVPVTQGEYLQQLIEVESEKQNKNTGNNYQSDTDQILAEMEKSYKNLLKVDAMAAAEFKTEIQKFKNDMANPETDSIPEGFLTSLKKELDNLSPLQQNKPARYSIGAIEKFGNFSGLIPDDVSAEGTALVKVAAEFSGLIHEKNAIKLLVISWNVGNNNSTSDKPSFFDGDASGFGLADYYMATLYHHQRIWENIRNLIQ